MDSRDITRRQNERSVKKKTMKDNSRSYSSTKPLSISQDSRYPQITSLVAHPASQQSLSAHGYLPKGSTTKTSDDTMHTPPNEKMIIVSLLTKFQ